MTFDYFGLDSSVSQKTLSDAYHKEKERLESEVFLKGAEGERAVRELSQIRERYAEARDLIRNRDFGEGEETNTLVREAVKSGEIDGLQAYLDTILNKDGYWHYLQSVAFYIKKLNFDSLSHLEAAVNADPENLKYQKALFRLEEKILLENEKR